MKNAPRSRRRRAGIVAIAVAALFVVLALVFVPREEKYAEYVRPDGHYRVIVYRRSRLFGAMPGQAGDAPGRAVLVDVSGRKLNETKLEMVQLVQVVDWSDKTASARLIFDWPVPD